ncbi:MAG: hypothetical protein AAF560_27060 [Acidobacteriota bacterium]
MNFGDYVRSLAPTGEPADAALDALWRRLRRLLRRALQRRGLWDRPPAYLGLTGHESWTTRESAGRRGLPARQGDALDELATDFYVETFVERLAALQRYAERGDDLEKVVSLRLRQFLHQRQRTADPLGDHLFQWLRSALQEALAEQRLGVYRDPEDDSGSGIHNGTVLVFNAGAESELASEDALAGLVERWNDELFVDWASARRLEADLVRRLADHVVGLAEEGIERFAFKSLIDIFKRDVRSRLAGLLGEPAKAAIEASAAKRLEQRDRIRQLSRCVEAGIHAGGGQQRTRDQLLKLWRFLERFALTTADSALPEGADREWTTALTRDSLPSNRQLSRLLKIRHDRFPALLARLRDEVRRCLSAPGDSGAGSGWDAEAKGAPDTLGRGAAPPRSEAGLDETRDLRHHLKRLTAEAYRRSAPSAPANEGPFEGEVLHFEACPEPGVEWLVAVADPAGNESLLIAADTLSWVGSADVAVRDLEPLGHLVLRTNLGVWLPHRELGTGHRSGVIAGADLARVLHQRDPATLVVDLSQRETDDDAEYGAWRRSLEAARNSIARVYGGRIDRPLDDAVAEPSEETVEEDAMPEELEPDPILQPVRRWWRRPPRELMALAASAIAVVAAGTALNHIAENRRLGERVAELQEVEAILRQELDSANAPMAAIPWLLAPLGATRGTDIQLTVPPGARHIGLLLDADHGDRVEVFDAAGDRVWSGLIDRIDSPDEALVVLPTALLPLGDYRIVTWRGDVLKVEFDVSLEAP